MELRDYVRVLRKSWALILAVTVVGIGLGVGLTLLTTKVYQANTQIIASASNTNNTNTALGGNSNFLEGRVQNYPSVATAPSVLGPTLDDPAVKAQLAKTHQKLDEQQLAKKVSADAPPSKTLVNLHVTDTNPTTAATLANVLSKYFIAEVTTHVEQKILVTLTSGKTRNVPAVQLTTIHNAVVPSTPVKPNKVLNIGVGLVLGLLIGIAVAILREILDNTVKTARDFDEMGIPLLAQVAFDKRANRSPIAFRGDGHSARAEAYRQLRTNLQFVDVDNPPRVIAVTSAVPGEGKSSTAINLAAALAEAGGRVCLVEADLRRPSIAKTLGLVSDVGFTTVVIGKAPVETVLQNAGKNLAVLTCGPIPPNPSELLISQHAKQVIYDIAEKVDFVIIDTPPLLPVTDGAEIATIADATILVHRAAKTTRDQALRSIEALAKVGRRPVGVILNMVTRATSRYDYEYGYYYATYRPSTTPATPAAASGTAVTTVKKEAPAAAEPEPEPAAAPVEPAAAAPKGRRARHRGARRAAEAAAADLADTDSFTPVTERAATAEPVDESVTELPAPVESAEGLDSPDGVDAASESAPAGVDDEFADEYDEFEEYGEYDDDIYRDERAAGVRGPADDDTMEFSAVQAPLDGPLDGPVEIDGQEELPLNERINGRSDEFDEHSFDEALGVRGDDRR